MRDRRDFLRLGLGSTLASVAIGYLHAAAEPQIRRYVRLGKTDLRISDISFGSASSSDPALVRHAFARGVNYFDSAESYRGGNAEEAIGAALQGKRDKVFLTSKTKAGASDTRKDMMQSLEQSLKRLRTDYVDVYFNHAVNDVARMQNQEWWEFTTQAKKQGKIRFRGMSGHGGRLVECLDYAIDKDLVDVILVAYNFGHDPKFVDKVRHTFHWAALQPELPRVLAKAKQKDIGIVAMKVLMGAKLNDMRPYENGGATFAQTAFRWTLSTNYADALIVSMTDKAQIDEYLVASGEYKLRKGDVELLERYAGFQLNSYCQPACNICESSCPHNVAIAEVLRTRMYAVDYRDPWLAKSEYASLEKNAAACLTCAHQSCLNRCPSGVPIATFTRDAASRLG